MSSARRRTLVFLLFVALTAALTYPQATMITTAVPYHTDPYFSMWRLNWVATHILTSPAQLLDTNIFHPERYTLAYSDAVLLPHSMLAPALWAGVSLITTYNLAILGALTLSGIAATRLAYELTRNLPASLVAGIVYAVAALIVAAVSVPYGLISSRATREVGVRRLEDVRHYGVTWKHYLAAPPGNRMYGRSLAGRGGGHTSGGSSWRSRSHAVAKACCSRGSSYTWVWAVDRASA
jgi:hypothetical protein